jgi:hypothetical protein
MLLSTYFSLDSLRRARRMDLAARMESQKFTFYHQASSFDSVLHSGPDNGYVKLA